MKKNLYDLTAPQKSILLTEQYYKGSSINNVCGTAFVEGEIDFDLLKKAVNLVIEHNDSFRLQLCLENNEVKQYLKEYKPVDIEIIDVATKEDVAVIENNLMKQVFDIYSNLFTFKLFRFPNGSGGFLLNIHHLISDSWTLGLTAREIVRTYSSLAQKEEPNFSTFSSYTDYIESEQEYIKSDKFQKDKEYWNSIFETIPDHATIPSIKPNHDDFSCIANRLTYTIDKSLMNQISDFCQSNHISSFNFFMAIYAIYIGRVSNVDDFVIGTPILNRTNFKEKNTTGMFINTAPIRINLSDEIDFKSFVDKIAKDSLSMLRHQKYSYQYILDDLRKENPNLPSLYNILISYQVTKANTETGLSYETRWAFNGTTSDDIDIHLYDINNTGNIDIAYDYNVDLFNDTDINNIHSRILSIVNQILENNSIALKDISILTEEEKYNIINTFNKTSKNFDIKNNIIELIDEVASIYPDRIAIEAQNDSITYKSLISNVNRCANYLVSKIDIKPHSNIGIFTSRNIDTLVGILAIIKAGCTYVPIDSEYPKERILYMIEQSEIDSILFSDSSLKNFAFTKSLQLIPIAFSCYSDFDSNFKVPLCCDFNDNLYIVFTSGSTGKPKGVTLSHKNMMNLILFEKECTSLFKKGDTHKVLQFATMSFDVSYQEIFSSFLTGSTLVLVTDDIRKNANKLANYIADKHVDTLFIPPAYLRLLTENEYCISQFSSCLKNIITAGEALIITKGINELLAHGICIHNHYGPAETHVATTYMINKPQEIGSMPIGYPIANTSIYILDSNLHLCPTNVIGQIAISGDCVGNGYFKRDDLTNEKFIQNTFDETNKIYLTGDLGYFDNSGCIYYIGRSDFQVKINGFRIELEEIDSLLTKHPNINSAISVIQTDNQKKHIITYYTSNEPLEESDLLNYLRSSLPNYMIPTKLVFLDSFILNPNGKVDKKMLPKVDLLSEDTEYIEPSTQTELKLQNIWKDIFNTNQIGANFNFFNIGGDSLLAIKLSSYILSSFEVDISVSDIFEHPVLSDLAYFIDSIKSKGNILKLEKAPQMDYYPLSSAQKRIYYACKAIGDNSIAYNIPGAILFDSVLDEKKILEVFRKLIHIHSSFRTSFKLINDEPFQIILDNVDFNIDVFNDTQQNIKTIIDSFPKPFDLANAPLLRVSVYYLDNKKTLILIDSHHIILDGTSLNILIKDFCKLYLGKEITRLPFDYADYSIWEKNYLNTLAAKKCENYWINRFRNAEIPTLNLPYDFNIPSSLSHNGERIDITLPKTLFNALDELAKSKNVSSYMLFLAVFYVLLYKYTSQNYIVIGTPIANRNIKELDSIIGMFVNNIVLDATIDSSITFEEFLKQIKQLVLDALHYQPYPYNHLVKNLSNNNSNLFDVMFVYQNNYQEKITLGDTQTQIIEAESHTSKFNLSLEIIPNTYTIHIDYCSDLFKRETVENFLNYYINLLKQVLENFNFKISDMSIFTSNEKHHLLYDFNNTAIAYPSDKTISQLFEEQVEKTPNNIAVVFENTKLTYQELNEKSNSLAWYLKECGIKPQDIVGISMHRSSEILISMLAILKLGATYLPIDPTYPESRIEYIVKDSNVNLILTKDDLIDTFSHISNVINVSLETNDIYKNFPTTNLPYLGKPEYLAYVIYTSGSTGNPKGVMITNKNVNNFVTGICNKIDFEKYSSIVSVTTMCFDIFVLESLLPLQKGLTVVLANEDEQNIAPLLNALCLKNNVEMLQTTPSRMSLLMSDKSSFDYLKNLKCIMLGGEPFPINLLRDLQELTNAKIFNMYGPTETTVWSTIKDLTYSSSITVGTPISNTTCYILDKDLNPVPIGLPGELYIGGSGVSNGYLHRESLTKEKFIKNPFVDNGIIYNTGDLASWNDNGEINCLGRSDFQVKIHGLRIELGEIESKILSYPTITKALVCIKVDNLKRQMLCGYFIANTRIASSNLKSYLATCLPNYMIPSYLIQLDDFKYTPNGKIDRNALPLPKVISTTSVIAPETQIEKKLVSLIEELLCISPISITDNFFEIGGDSILALKLQTKLMNENMNISYSDIYKYNTVKELALKIESNQNSQKALVDSSYDFTNINTILSRNVKENLSNLVFKDIGNVLLTGSTGFLGIHILAHIIDNTKNKVYCLIRKDPSTSLKDKLLNKLHYYFGIKYDDLIDDRIIILNSDITKSDLGLNDYKIKNIFENISCIINSAATVKHYGYYSDFENINVTAVKNLVHYCEIFNKKFIQISTISVSGNTLTDLAINENYFENDIYFDENCLYIGQNLNNVYVRSKYEAEKFILEEIYLNKLDALILRIGNITNRTYDGLFQMNANENAFMHRMEALLDLNTVPDYILDDYVEFSPVDLVAKAVVSSIEYSNNINVLHIYNQNHVLIRDLIKLFPNSVNIVSEEKFKQILKKQLTSNSKLIYITSDLDKDYHLIYSSNIKIRNNLSREFFDKINFKWNTIDKTYITQMIKQFYREE